MMMVLYLIFVLQRGVSELGEVPACIVKNNDAGTLSNLSTSECHSKVKYLLVL